MLLAPTSPPVTNCHTLSDPLLPRAWRTLWTAPNSLTNFASEENACDYTGSYHLAY